MAKPRLFVSSTFYDLRYIREEVAAFLKQLGYEPVMFEDGHVPYGSHEALEEYCYKEIERCDILVSIVGGRYGSKSHDSTYSITQKELRKALEIGKQVYIFVEKKVYDEFGTYEVNKDNKTINFRHVDDRRIFEFLDEIRSLPRNNSMFPFDLTRDINEILREQLSGLFQRLLHESEEKNRFEFVDEYKESLRMLQELVNDLRPQAKQAPAVTGSDAYIFAAHPAFARVRQILRQQHPCVFTTYDELDALFLSQGYERYDIPYTDFTEWIKNTHGVQHAIRVSKRLFTANTRQLVAIEPDQWEDRYIQSFEDVVEEQVT